MKAVIYARYSSDKQSEQSIDGQMRICKDYARQNGIEIIGDYIDRAVSGRFDNRPNFQLLIRDSKRSLFDTVLVYKFDRFARSKYDSAVYKRQLKKNGVKVVSASEYIPDAPEGIILESMLEGYAEYFSAELSQKVKRGQVETLAKKGYLGGGVPYGYDISSDNKFVINEEQAHVVREIFTKYTSGVTTTKILKWLKDSNIKRAQGGDFGNSGVMSILKNTKYIGTLKFGDKMIEDYTPVIVEKEIFEKAQVVRTRNAKSGARGKAPIPYLLSGKLFCGKCHTSMHGESGTSRSGDIHLYYKCHKRKKNSSACDKATVRKYELEQMVVDLTIEHIFDEKILPTTVANLVSIMNKNEERDIELAMLEKQAAKTERELSNIMKAIKMGIFSQSTQSELISLEDLKMDIAERIDTLNLQLKISMTEPEIFDWINQFNHCDDSDEIKKERIIDSFVSKVILYDNRIIIAYNHAGDNITDVVINELELCSNSQSMAPSRGIEPLIPA